MFLTPRNPPHTLKSWNGVCLHQSPRAYYRKVAHAEANRGFNTLPVSRGFASTSYISQQNAATNHKKSDTLVASKADSSGDAGPDKPAESNGASRPYIAALEKCERIQEELEMIQKTLADSEIQMTSEARARRKAKASALEAKLQGPKEKCSWWFNTFYKDLENIKTSTEFIERVKITKDRLNLDAQREKPIWTAQEKEALEKELME
ncbi:MAG: hypothetical protein Q9222_005493 [Ikaeria aurantiellina]